MKGRLFVLPGTRYGFTVADSPPQPPATSVSTEMMTEVLDSVKMKKEEGMEREWGWLRFVFTENLGGKTEKLLQLSSLAICNPGSSERPGILTNQVEIKEVTNPSGSSPFLEEVTSLVSGHTNNKWLDRNFRSHTFPGSRLSRTRGRINEFLMKYHQGEGFSVVDFELSEVHRILGYVLWAGNDAPSRDPISWVVMGKKTKNDKQWSLLDVRSNVRSPDRFQIYSFFPLNYGDWEKEEKDDWGLMPPIQGGGYLNALDVSLYDSKDLVRHWKRTSPSLPEYQQISQVISVHKQWMSFSFISSCLSFVSSLMKHEEGEEEEGRLCGWRGGKERERRVFEELVKDCVCLAYKIESKSPPTALPLEVPLVRPLNILTDTQRKKAEGLSCHLHRVNLVTHINSLYQSMQWRGAYLFFILRELRSLEDPGGMMGVLALLAKGGGECQVRRVDSFNTILQRFCRLHVVKYGERPSPPPQPIDYGKLTVGEMKKILKERLVDYREAVEKTDLKDLLIGSSPDYGSSSSMDGEGAPPELVPPGISTFNLFLPPDAPTPPYSLLPSPSIPFVEAQQRLLSGLSEFLESFKMKALQATFTEPSKLVFHLSNQNIPRDDVDIHGVQTYSGLVLATLGVQVAIETQQFDDVKGCVPFLEKQDIIQPYLDELWNPDNLGVPYSTAIRKVGNLPLDKIRQLRGIPSRGFIFPHFHVRKLVNEANNPDLNAQRLKLLPYLTQFAHYFHPSILAEKAMLALLGEQKYRKSLDLCFAMFQKGVLGGETKEEEGKKEEKMDEEMGVVEDGKKEKEEEKGKAEMEVDEPEGIDEGERMGKAEMEGLKDATVVEEWVYDIENNYEFSVKKAHWFLYFLGFLKQPTE